MAEEQYGAERRGLRAKGRQQPGGLLGVDHPEWSGRWGGFYPKMPPKMEAMTMPRTTQQMMIMIFFCTREAGRKGLRQGIGAAGQGEVL